MKLTLGLFLICLQMSAAGLAQTVTISERNVTLERLLEEINRQAGYDFVADVTVASDAHPVDISVSNASVEKVLSIFFENQPLTFRIEDRLVIVTRKEIDKVEVEIPAEPQKTNLAGKVTSKLGEPLIGVSIVVKGTTKGTTTNVEGNYVLDVDPGDVLVFSSIGYKSTEILVGARTLLDVVLEEDVTKLGEVVINGGYYQTTDARKTGSIVKITSKEIENQPVTSPLMALQGRVAGLDITSTSGMAGAAPVIRIRGNNSLRVSGKNTGLLGDGNYPLYIIDGVPISAIPIEGAEDGPDGSKYDTGIDPLSTLNPDNIASIEVLKDGDATAIYGSRGANGVILITTKRNNSATGQSINLKVYQGVGKVARMMDLLDTRQFLEMQREAFRHDGLEPNSFELKYYDSTRYTDWQKELIGGTAGITDVQLGLSSGNRNTMFNFSGSYHKETLVTPGDFGSQRATGNLSVNHASKDEKFRAALSVNYGMDFNKIFSGNMVGSAIELAPNAPSPYDENGALNWAMRVGDDGVLTTTYYNNPMADVMNTSAGQNRNLVASGTLSYEIRPELSFSVNLGLNDFVGLDKAVFPAAARPPAFDISGQRITKTGSATFLDNRRSSAIIEPKLSYNGHWGVHRLDAIVGTTAQQSNSSFERMGGNGYVSDALLGSPQGAATLQIMHIASTYKFVSAYSRVGYNLKDRYLLNLTGRTDGSSRFGPNKRFGLFGAIGGAWIFSEENLIKNALPFMSFGKIRGSYGITGSDGIGDYKYYNLYKLGQGQYQGLPNLTPSALYNAEYAWEVTRKLEAAIELGFLQNRISVQFNWFRNRSSNQLIDYPLPATTGFDSILKNFEATVQNTGVEMMVRGDVIAKDNLTWSISFNASLPRNVLLKFDNIENSPYKDIYKVGEPLSIRWLFTYLGVNPQTGKYEVADLNNDGLFNGLDRRLMNPMEKSYYGGIENTFRYKQFDLSFLFQFTRAKQTRYVSFGITENKPVTVLDRWRQPGDITDEQRFALSGSENGDVGRAYTLAASSDYSMVDASFIRLKTVAFGYHVPSTWASRLKLRQAMIFVRGQNILTISGYKEGFDPETGRSLPPLRMITAGIQLQF